MSFAGFLMFRSYSGGVGGRVGLWDTLSVGSRADRAADFARMAGGSQ